MNTLLKSVEEFALRFHGPYQLFVWKKEAADTFTEAREAKAVYSHGFPFYSFRSLLQALAVIERARTSLAIPALGVAITDPLFNRLELKLGPETPE